MPIKVDLVEAGLASGLSRAADRHDHGQASCLGHRDDPQGAPTTTRRRDLSRPQTLYYADADT